MVASAFFSGMEIAFISANKLQIEVEKKQGTPTGRILSWFLGRESQFIGTMLVGNNFALVIYGIYMAVVLEPQIKKIPGFDSTLSVLLLQTLISTLVILVTAEFLPKTIFRLNPNKVLNIFAIPLTIIFGILWVPMIITIGLSQFILKSLFKVEISEEKPVFGRTDVDHFLKKATESVDVEEELDHEIQIFQNALDFSKVKARECMVPRTELVCCDINEDLGVIREKFIETGLSKILIYRDSMDNIIGYVHSSELFKKPETIPAILLPISIVPETMAANEILAQFIKQRRSMAVVVDEFGGTSGLVTMEDVVEEIFGDIEDEHDQEELVDNRLSENEFEFAARLEIDFINEKYRLGLPEGEEYETLAGLIIEHHEDIPELNQEIQIDAFHFRITEVSENRIERVYLKVKEPEA